MKSASIIVQRANGEMHEHKFEAQNKHDMQRYYASWMNHPANRAILGCICDWTDSPVLDYYR